MGRHKQKKFAEVEGFPNVIQLPHHSAIHPFGLKGKWATEYFKNRNPVILELGCGKGEYSLALSKLHPDKNYIGLDIKGARIWKGAKIALQENLNNVAFLRTRIDFIESFFAPGEVSEIWIPFPDPYPARGKEQKRLMSVSFISRYRNIAPPGTVVHLKTDNYNLYLFTIKQAEIYGYPIIMHSEDIHSESPERYSTLTNIITFYEKQFIEEGKKIFYVEFAI